MFKDVTNGRQKNHPYHVRFLVICSICSAWYEYLSDHGRCLAARMQTFLSLRL